MDAVTDPAIHTVVVMKAAQIGWTEILNNVLGYFIDQDPAPVLLVQPTLDMASDWSKNRFAPMVRDTPCLVDKVADAKARDSGNTILHKTFRGGHVTIAGANSPAGLAARPIRIVLCDEVDRYPPSAGAEGDPVSLARKRMTTFWNRKLLMGSTPTVKGISRIEPAYDDSDQRKYWVPCPHCGETQTLKWAGVTWPEGEPESAHYVCEHNGCIITDADKPAMTRAGEWIAAKETNGIAGFHINELYSPWSTFPEIAQAFVKAKPYPETLKTWINMCLGETWEDAAAVLDDASLLARVENYGPEVPYKGVLLTAGVDFQDDRIEVEVVAWGRDQESWNVEYNVIYGDPTKPEIWKQLDDYLLTTFDHESGRKLRIVAAGLDTGHHTKQVYSFCKPRFARRVFALKGIGGTGKPLASRPSRSNIARVHLFPIGVDSAKEILFGRLKLTEPGPGYCHFPAERKAEYFAQLTAEKAVTKYVRGRPSRAWVKRTANARNEALDCRVYAMAALEILNTDLDKHADRMEAAPQPDEVYPQVATRRRGIKVISRGIS